MLETCQADAQKHLKLQVCVTAEEDSFSLFFVSNIQGTSSACTLDIPSEKEKQYFNEGVTMDTENGRGHYYLHAAAGIYPED